MRINMFFNGRSQSYFLNYQIDQKKIAMVIYHQNLHRGRCASEATSWQSLELAEANTISLFINGERASESCSRTCHDRTGVHDT